MKIITTAFALMLCLASALHAQQERTLSLPEELQNLQFGLLVGVNADYSKGSDDWNNFYDEATAFFDFQYDFFILTFSFEFTNQGKFDSNDDKLGHWYQLHEGLLAFDFDRFFLSLGWSPHRDVIDSPYSLFVSSVGKPALNGEFAYEGDIFFINSRWIGLSLNSAIPDEDTREPNRQGDSTLQDRGMNFRNFGINFANGLRVGYQEAIIYLDTYFDPFYFAAPIPYQFSQLVMSDPGSPFQTAPDPNILGGLFIDYTSGAHYTYIQFLLDDFTFTTTGKMAWSLGYRITTDVGRFGFFHAGATKDTFQATRESSNYPYLHYATNRYQARDGSQRTVWYFDNYIGYLYGENTLSFRIEYDHIFGPMEFSSGLEYVVSADKSPTNPWHGNTRPPGGTFPVLLLDSDRLEHTILFDFATVTEISKDFDLLVDGSIGYVFNELALIDPPLTDDVQRSIFSPSVNSRLLFSAFIGVQYTFNSHEVPWRERRNLPQKRR